MQVRIGRNLFVPCRRLLGEVSSERVDLRIGHVLCKRPHVRVGPLVASERVQLRRDVRLRLAGQRRIPRIERLPARAVADKARLLRLWPGAGIGTVCCAYLKHGLLVLHAVHQIASVKRARNGCGSHRHNGHDDQSPLHLRHLAWIGQSGKRLQRGPVAGAHCTVHGPSPEVGGFCA